jgi:pyruvate,water dikinase
MKEPLLLEFSDAAATRAGVAGGKGASLALLTQGGFRVPPGVVVAAQAYRIFLTAATVAHARIAALDFSSDAALHAGCAAVRQALLDQPLPGALEQALRARRHCWPVVPCRCVHRPRWRTALARRSPDSMTPT